MDIETPAPEPRESGTNGTPSPVDTVRPNGTASLSPAEKRRVSAARRAIETKARAQENGGPPVLEPRPKAKQPRKPRVSKKVEAPTPQPELPQPKVALTVIENEHGPVAKRFWLDADGTFQKQSAAQIYEGVARIMEVDGLAGLMALRAGLASHQALIFGVPSLPEARVVTQEELLRSASNEALIARDRDHLAFLAGRPGVLMLDCDVREGHHPLDWREIDAILCKLVPGWSKVARAYRPSSTAFIYGTDGKEHCGPRGWRIYAIVDDAANIPNVGAYIYQALWATGHGYIVVSKSGQALDRSIVDASVWQPERLDFAAEPDLGVGLKRRVPVEAEGFIPGDPMLATAALQPKWTMAEWRKKSRKLRNARKAEAEQIAKARKEFVSARVDEMKASGLPKAEIAQMATAYARAVEALVLTGGFRLKSSDDKIITVKELLADADRWDGARFADPLEPGYRADSRIAYACLRPESGRPYIFSHAHGGMHYTLLQESDGYIDRLNENHAVVRVGGKTRVVTLEESPAVRGTVLVPVFSTLKDFRDFHENPRIDYVDENGRIKKLGLGTYWVKHPKRRQHNRVIFDPEADPNDPSIFNLWRGFAVEPNDAGLCTRYLEHVTDNICSGDTDHAQYLLDLMAWRVQNPGKRPEVGTVLRSIEEGTGKGVAIRNFGELFGPHFLQVSHADHLVGNFNSHLQQCCVMYPDEAFFAGDRRHEGRLKALITEPTIQIEPKGVDSYTVINRLMIFMSSNNEWVVPAGPSARRYFVLDVSEKKKQNTEYFAAIEKEMQAGGRSALLHYLLYERDISDFDIRAVPHTKALADQKARTRRGVDLLVELLIEEGALPSTHTRYPHVVITTGEERGEGFWPRARTLVPSLKHESSRVTGNTLKGEWGCKPYEANGQCGLKFPPLDELRATFDKKHGKQDWDSRRQTWGQELQEAKESAEKVDVVE